LAKLRNGVVSDSLADAYEEVKAAIPQQTQLGSDETSFKKNWVWCISSACSGKLSPRRSTTGRFKAVDMMRRRAKNQFWIGTQDQRCADADHPFKSWQANRHANDSTKRSHEVALRNGFGRRNDVHARRRFIGDRPRKDVVRVALVNPRYSLSSATDATAKPQFRDQAKSRESLATRATIASNDELGPDEEKVCGT
jgi:hypothetical protein